MSSRPQFNPYQVITNGDMTTTLTSRVTIMQKLSLISYAVSWAGTSPVGAVTVQVSNDYTTDESGAVSNAGTWTTLTLSASTNVSGNSGTGFINLSDLAGYAIRLVYTPTSGTGTFQAFVAGKVA